VFRPDSWRLAETRFSERYSVRAETIFAVADVLTSRGTGQEGAGGNAGRPSSNVPRIPRSPTPKRRLAATGLFMAAATVAVLGIAGELSDNATEQTLAFTPFVSFSCSTH
jgi:hypothetical protein